MKKQPLFSALALAALAAAAGSGCTSADTAATASSPWSQPGSNTGPNPILSGAPSGQERDAQQNELIASKHYETYSWRRDKQPAPAGDAAAVQYSVPENPRSIRITGIAEKSAALAFICADTSPFTEKQQININDGKNAAYVRVVRKDDARNLVVAELLPNQVDIPKFELGGELSYATTAQETPATPAGSGTPAGAAPAAAPAAPAGPAAAPGGPEEPPALPSAA